MTVTDANRTGADAAASSRKPRLAVAATYPIHPPLGGGQVRAAQLYGGLSAAFDIELVTLVAGGTPAARSEIAPGLVECQVPKSDAHAAREFELERAAGTVVTDLAFAELYAETPEYLAALRRATRGAHAIVACHPYPFRAIRAVSELPVWYEAQDVEATLKRHVLGTSAEAQRLLALAETVERDCCRAAELVWACSEEDCDELVARYGIARERVLIVPNGAPVDEVEYVSPARRAEVKRRLGLDGRFLAVFVASWHEPNLVAARELLAMATRVPDVDLMIVGSVGLALAGERLPANVQVTGLVSAEFKATVLGLADVALNPVRTGSGTNLKMLEYFASGTPVISTAFGARGLGVRDGDHYIHAEAGGFPAALRAVRALPPASREPLAQSAREHVTRTFAWRIITDHLLDELRARDGRLLRAGG